MYYEEKLIDGKWYWKWTPDMEWKEFTQARYVKKINELEQQNSAYRKFYDALIEKINPCCGVVDIVDIKNIARECGL